MEPTPEQTRECYRVCSELTKMFISVHIVRLDERTGEIYILVGHLARLSPLLKTGNSYPVKALSILAEPHL